MVGITAYGAYVPYYRLSRAAIATAWGGFPGAGEIEDIESCSALDLFEQSARRVKPNFCFDVKSEEQAIEICKLVGGLPLGIELAASWLRTLNLEEIVGEIEENFDFLESSSRDLPDRHRSLRGVFNYSWRLLEAEERQVLAKLSMFR